MILFGSNATMLLCIGIMNLIIAKLIIIHTLLSTCTARHTCTCRGREGRGVVREWEASEEEGKGEAKEARDGRKGSGG